MAGTESSRKAIQDYARLLITEHTPLRAFETYFSPALIQHDPDIGDSNEGDTEFLEGRREAEPETYLSEDQYETVVHNILADGDLVAIKSHCFTGRHDAGRVLVDMWRIADGKFAEHWSAIEPIAESEHNPMPIWCGKGGDYKAAAALGDTVAAPICGTPGDPAQRAESLALVRGYLDALKDPERIGGAVDRYVADDCTEYSPRHAHGKQALVAHLSTCAARGETFKAARFLADGNFVLIHGRAMTPEHALGYSQMHLYRVDGGKIVAHWAVRQPIPTYSVAGHAMVEGPLEEGRKKGPAPPGSAHH